jgi:hypothetical protein
LKWRDMNYLLLRIATMLFSTSWFGEHEWFWGHAGSFAQ